MKLHDLKLIGAEYIELRFSTSCALADASGALDESYGRFLGDKECDYLDEFIYYSKLL
jgi:hypothetical protein